MIDIEYDACDILLRNITQYLPETTNLKTCPLIGHSFVKGLDLKIKKYPSVLPAGSYRLDFEYFTKMNGKNVHLVTAQIFATLKYIGNIFQH